MNLWYVVFGVAVAAIAIVSAYFYLRFKEDPIKSANAGFLSALIVLFGSVGLPDFEVNGKLFHQDEILGMPIEAIDFTIKVGTPMPIWVTACLSLVVLLCWYGKLLIDDRKHEREHGASNAAK